MQLYGALEARDLLKPIFADAGSLLADMPAADFPVSIPGAMLTADDSLRRWLFFLFDLAWAKVPGSPLRVSVEKSAWHENTSVTLEMVLLYRGTSKPWGPIKAMLTNIPEAVRQTAFDAGYVDRDHSYRAGDRSQTYWILRPHDHARLGRREISNSGLRHNVRKWLEGRRRRTWQRIHGSDTPVAKAVCLHLWRNLHRVRLDLEIDGSKASGKHHPFFSQGLSSFSCQRKWDCPLWPVGEKAMLEYGDPGAISAKSNLPDPHRRSGPVDRDRRAQECEQARRARTSINGFSEEK